MTQALDTFFGAWSLSDANARSSAIESALAKGATYADPRTSEPLNGPAAVSEYVAMFAQAAPGATATVVKSDETSGALRATVEFKMADGIVQLGQYFVRLDASDKITEMTGFVGTGAPE